MPSSEVFIKFIIISKFAYKSSNQFLMYWKSPFIPLLQIIDKYFLLLDNKATHCLGFMLKFLLRDNIKNSRAEVHWSYDFFWSREFIFKVWSFIIFFITGELLISLIPWLDRVSFKKLLLFLLILSKSTEYLFVPKIIFFPLVFFSFALFR